MDPNQTYRDMLDTQRDGDHAAARELAHALTDWFAKGGFHPVMFSPEEIHAEIARVLGCTDKLDF